MRQISSRRRTEAEPMTPDLGPDAANFVYCVGCGTPLGARSSLLRGKGGPITIYCQDCTGKDFDSAGEHGPLTFCFRCGTQHVRYIEAEPYRTIHSICPRCQPERAKRYGQGNFAPPEPEPVPEEAAEVAK